jgi:hypothetical protein
MLLKDVVASSKNATGVRIDAFKESERCAREIKVNV